MKKTKKDLERDLMEMSKKFERLNKEYSMKKAEIRDLKAEVKKLNEDIVIAFEEEEVEVIGQPALVGAFKTKLKEIVKTYHNTTVKDATPRQKEMIRNGEKNSFVEMSLFLPEKGYEDDMVIVSREINLSGKNICKDMYVYIM